MGNTKWKHNYWLVNTRASTASNGQSLCGCHLTAREALGQRASLIAVLTARFSTCTISLLRQAVAQFSQSFRQIQASLNTGV
ncbi:hypothetical protein I4641_02850 [Waterburya agarophytonicola K14]|uniref:Uncharacterized protein n=1 Tax=Waterburya agarophytonicola KI4 TaxID=2874699 RepID=A0A964FFX4_9CYAN|nr:hypothetical protein [Waterburya agarophytonicola]MCC0175918.1 hypothetical protein [Waterburya agarophytonicola KI4]